MHVKQISILQGEISEIKPIITLQNTFDLKVNFLEINYIDDNPTQYGGFITDLSSKLFKV